MNKNYPPKVECEILSLNANELVLSGKDAEGKLIILYMKSQ